MIAPKVTSYVTPTRHEAPPTTTRIITRVPTADEAREILRGEPPATIDPARVKPGDMVTLETDGGRKVTAPRSERYAPGTWFLDVYPDDDPVPFSAVHWTLTAHTPAPEPELEWASEERRDG